MPSSTWRPQEGRKPKFSLLPSSSRARPCRDAVLFSSAVKTPPSRHTSQGSFLLEQWRNLYALMHHREDMPPAWVAVVRRV